MEVVTFLIDVGSVLLRLKGMCDQHDANQKEIKNLLDFIQNYEVYVESLPALLEEVGVPAGVGKNQLTEKLKTDIQEATKQLQEWAKDRKFFRRLLNSTERVQDVQCLQLKLMNFMLIAQGIHNQSLQLHLVAQGNRIESLVTEHQKRLASLKLGYEEHEVAQGKRHESMKLHVEKLFRARPHQTAHNSLDAQQTRDQKLIQLPEEGSSQGAEPGGPGVGAREQRRRAVCAAGAGRLARDARDAPEEPARHQPGIPAVHGEKMPRAVPGLRPRLRLQHCARLAVEVRAHEPAVQLPLHRVLREPQTRDLHAVRAAKAQLRRPLHE